MARVVHVLDREFNTGEQQMNRILKVTATLSTAALLAISVSSGAFAAKSKSNNSASASTYEGDASTSATSNQSAKGKHSGAVAAGLAVGLVDQDRCSTFTLSGAGGFAAAGSH